MVCIGFFLGISEEKELIKFIKKTIENLEQNTKKYIF